MWRLLVLVLVGPVWAEGDLGEEDAGYLERRLDDLDGLDAAAVRWRVRGAEAARERLQLYQRVEVVPVSGQAFFGLAERDPGESGWSDFRTFYYAVQRRRSEWVVGDLRPGTGAGLVFGRNRRGSIAPRMPAGDSRRLGYRSSGENHALRGARGVTRVGRGVGCCSGVGRIGMGAWTNRGRCGRCRERLSRDRDRDSWPRSAGHPRWRRSAALAGRALAVGHDPAGLGLFTLHRLAAEWADALGFCRRWAARGSRGRARGLGSRSSGVGGGR